MAFYFYYRMHYITFSDKHYFTKLTRKKHFQKRIFIKYTTKKKNFIYRAVYITQKYNIHIQILFTYHKSLQIGRKSASSHHFIVHYSIFL